MGYLKHINPQNKITQNLANHPSRLCFQTFLRLPSNETTETENTTGFRLKKNPKTLTDGTKNKQSYALKTKFLHNQADFLVFFSDSGNL